MDTKTFVPKDLKFSDDEVGTFEAVFATLNVIDAHGDVTLPGAFGEQEVVISQYNHGSWDSGARALPIGVGKIFERGEEAIVQGEFNLRSQAGADTYKTIRWLAEKGRNQEWSYALPEIQAETGDFEGQSVRFLKKVRVPEVSPVLEGAGINTRLLSIKTAGDTKKAFASHSTGTNDGAWDGPANKKRVKEDQGASYYGRIYAWKDPEGETGVKGTYKFIHHFVSGDGDPGAASTRACSTGIAVLNGARGGTTIPDADRRGVWRHLAKHLQDADLEPPELRSRSTAPGYTLTDHIELVIAEVKGLSERIAEVRALKPKGKNISEDKLARVALLCDELRGAADVLAADDEDESHVVLTTQFLRFQQTLADYRGGMGNAKHSTYREEKGDRGQAEETA